MVDPVADLRQRVADLEREVRALAERVRNLEQFTAPRVEHPQDRQAVQQKVTFDWQS